mgnify:CR=1 FL=1
MIALNGATDTTPGGPATVATDVAIRPVAAAELEARLGEFADLLHACVHAGASVGFVRPHPLEEAEAFWRGVVLPAARAGRRVVLVATVGERVVGSVQIAHDTPANQPHRADVTKLLVHPSFRRRGIARRLMDRLEETARALGRSLLTLDTRTGDAAEPLYRSLGFVAVGTIPGYCLDPSGRVLESTTIMFKRL